MRLAIILFATICILIVQISATTTDKSIHASHHVVKATEQHHLPKPHEEAHGHSKLDEQHAVHKAVKKAGKKTKHDEESAKKGQHLVVNHRVEDAEAGGKKSKSHNEDQHQSHKKAGAHSEHGAKFQETAKHKKAGFAKGFREQYHKNEHKKHDSFYSNGHKSGDYKIFNAKKSNHHGQKFEKDDHNKHASVKSMEKHGKQGKKLSGHNVNDQKAHKASGGKKTSFDHQEKWAKKNQQNSHDKHKYKYVPIVDKQ